MCDCVKSLMQSVSIYYDTSQAPLVKNTPPPGYKKEKRGKRYSIPTRMPNKLLEHENFWRLCAISGEYFDIVWGFCIEQSVGSCFFFFIFLFW